MPIEDASTLLPLMWAPLTVITAAHRNERGGQIAVGTFTASIVPDRPRVLAEIQKRNHTHQLIEASGMFAIHLIAREQWQWVRHWGFHSQAETDKFKDIPWQEGPQGLPILDGVLGWLACKVTTKMNGGDMTIYLADVFDAQRNTPAQPIRWHEVQQMLPEEWREEYGRKLAHDVPDSARRMGEISEMAAMLDSTKTAPFGSEGTLADV